MTNKRRTSDSIGARLFYITIATVTCRALNYYQDDSRSCVTDNEFTENQRHDERRGKEENGGGGKGRSCFLPVHDLSHDTVPLWRPP